MNEEKLHFKKYQTLTMAAFQIYIYNDYRKQRILKIRRSKDL